MSQKELAKVLGVPQNTLSQWESGKRIPDLTVLIKIAEFFKVSVDYLIGREYEPSEMCNMRVPFLDDKSDITDNCVYYTAHMSDRGRYRAFTVNDNAMLPSADIGDTVIFRKQITAEDNDAVVIAVGCEKPKLRRIKWQSEGITLFSDSLEFNPEYYSSKDISELPVVICGKAVELRRKLKND